MADIDKINSVVRKFKINEISHTECFTFIEQSFRPLFFSKKKSMSNTSTDHRYTGSFWDVYLDTIEYSLKNFDFTIHHEWTGTNKISFVPYFKEMFNNRCNEYKKILGQEIEKNKNLLSLENLLESPKFSSPSKNSDVYDYIQHNDETVKNEMEFEEFLKNEVLTKKEYKIFYMKMRGRNNQYIASKMKYPTNRQQISKEWISIAAKIADNIKKRKNDC